MLDQKCCIQLYSTDNDFIGYVKSISKKTFEIKTTKFRAYAKSYKTSEELDSDIMVIRSKIGVLPKVVRK